jgi:hypothetical protein
MCVVAPGMLPSCGGMGSVPQKNAKLPAAQREGKAIGQQVRAIGRNMLLGPTVNIAPAFLFGHGLSCSTSVCSNLQVNSPKIGPGQPVQVNLSVRNTGSREGAEAEVVQLYVRDVQSSVDRPARS